LNVVKPLQMRIQHGGSQKKLEIYDRIKYLYQFLTDCDKFDVV